MYPTLLLNIERLTQARDRLLERFYDGDRDEALLLSQLIALLQEEFDADAHYGTQRGEAIDMLPNQACTEFIAVRNIEKVRAQRETVVVTFTDESEYSYIFDTDQEADEKCLALVDILGQRREMEDGLFADWLP